MRLVPSEHISYFILNIYSALTGVYSMEIVGGDEEFPWKEKPRAETRGGLHRFDDISWYVGVSSTAAAFIRTAALL